MRFATILLIALIAIARPAAAGNTPRATVETFHDALIEVMKQAKSLPVKERYAKLEAPVTGAFNFPVMIRIIAGSRWKKNSAEDQAALSKAFERVSVGTYAFRFDGYSGQKFETLGEGPGPQDTTLVKTHIASPGDSPVKLNYLLRKFENDWRIIDVLLDGNISELAVRASEYRSLLRSKGAAGLAAALNKKADQLISGN
ncbi:MAG: ABC transporter substrate-binding protein [Rhodospirillaceae bacterium]